MVAFTFQAANLPVAPDHRGRAALNDFVGYENEEDNTVFH